MKKILIIRFSSIGDIVLTTPVVRCAKAAGHEVHYITKKKFEPVLTANPNIDKLWVFDKEITEIAEELKRQKFDFIIDLHHNLRSLRLKKLLGRPSSSFSKINFKKWLIVRLKINRLPDVHIVDRYFAAAEKAGIVNDKKGLDYFIAQKDEITSASLPVGFQSGYVAFAIGAQHSTKRLPTEKIKATCSELKLPVILLGGKEDSVVAEEIVSVNPELIYNACGNYSLGGSASVVKNAKVLITHDTGLMHIGAALHKKIISVWGNTIPEFGMYPYMPGEEQNYKIVEVKNLSCRPCSKIGFQECPKKHFDCMNKIDVNEIVRLTKEFYS